MAHLPSGLHKTAYTIAHAALVSILMIMLGIGYLSIIPPGRPPEYIQVASILIFSHVVLFVWLVLKLHPVDDIVHSSASHLDAINQAVSRIDQATSTIATTIDVQNHMTRELLERIGDPTLALHAETAHQAAANVKTMASELNTQNAELQKSVNTFFSVIRKK